MRICSALEAANDDVFFALQTSGPRYCESTLRKHSWVIKLFEAFSCRSLIPAFPLNADSVGWFIRFIGIETRLAIGSIEDVIIPSLKRIHRERTGSDPSPAIVCCMSNALRDVRRSPSCRRGAGGKQPAIVSDVEHIVKCMPDGLPSKAGEASLFLTSVSTGARAITCDNLLVGDIKRFLFSEDSCKILLQIEFRVTKGNPKWDHEVTLEGDFTTCSPNNVVYWLELHLLRTFEISIQDIDFWREDVKIQKVWPWGRDSMRELFKSRAMKAGFPANLFSFHSMRAGFLCSALLKAGTDSNQINAVLEHTGHIAGWKPGKAAQLRYVKEAAKRTIVATRVVQANEGGRNRRVIDPVLTTTENFHGIRLKASQWCSKTNYCSFQQKLDVKFTVASLSDREKISLKSRCWRKSLGIFVKNSAVLEREARKIFKKNPHWKTKSGRSITESNARMVVGRKKIASMLEADFTLLDELIEKLESFVEEDLRICTPIRLLDRPKTVPVPSTRPIFIKSGHRKRRLWNPEEDLILVSGIHSGTAYADIQHLLNDRSNVDCKDRWRNILKKYGTEDKIFKEFKLN
jgi:hypothetical protein